MTACLNELDRGRLAFRQRRTSGVMIKSERQSEVSSPCLLEKTPPRWNRNPGHPGSPLMGRYSIWVFSASQVQKRRPHPFTRRGERKVVFVDFARPSRWPVGEHKKRLGHHDHAPAVQFYSRKRDLSPAVYLSRIAGSPSSVHVRRISEFATADLARAAASPTVAGVAPNNCR
jgi:hypothetical protein